MIKETLYIKKGLFIIYLTKSCLLTLTTNHVITCLKTYLKFNNKNFPRTLKMVLYEYELI